MGVVRVLVMGMCLNCIKWKFGGQIMCKVKTWDQIICKVEIWVSNNMYIISGNLGKENRKQIIWKWKLGGGGGGATLCTTLINNY